MSSTSVERMPELNRRRVALIDREIEGSMITCAFKFQSEATGDFSEKTKWANMAAADRVIPNIETPVH